MSESDRRLLTGWGRTAATAADVVQPANHEALVSAIAAGSPTRGVIARGLGRSYGDAAQNAGGLVIDTRALGDLIKLDPVTGVVCAGAGMSLDTLLRLSLPHGWFVPVTPGTRFVSLGGALAADIHGKNHHWAGSFARHVAAFDLVTADGDTRTITPDDESGLFWGTAGGMGLTGVIVRVTLQLIAVESASVIVDTHRVPDLDAVMATLSEADADVPYSVAWIDGTSTGAHLGRGVVTLGRHAPASAVRSGEARLLFDPRQRVSAPGWVPPKLVNAVSVRAFNEMWFRKSPRHSQELQSIAAFFHPLDGVDGWNRMYGPRGFVQHQLVVPFAARMVIQQVLERLTTAGAPCFLGVLKRFGPANPGPLSFPRPGWTLALDIPAEVPGLARLLDGFDRLVAEAGGSVYLAKDGRLDPRLLDTLYPRVEEFRSLRAAIDPHGAFTSDLSRRLSL